MHVTLHADAHQVALLVQMRIIDTFLVCLSASAQVKLQAQALTALDSLLRLSPVYPLSVHPPTSYAALLEVERVPHALLELVRTGSVELQRADVLLKRYWPWDNAGGDVEQGPALSAEQQGFRARDSDSEGDV